MVTEQNNFRSHKLNRVKPVHSPRITISNLNSNIGSIFAIARHCNKTLCFVGHKCPTSQGEYLLNNELNEYLLNDGVTI